MFFLLYTLIDLSNQAGQLGKKELSALTPFLYSLFIFSLFLPFSSFALSINKTLVTFWAYHPAIVFHAHIYPCTNKYNIITNNAINKIVLNGDLFFLFGLLLSISVMMIIFYWGLYFYTINRWGWGNVLFLIVDIPITLIAEWFLYYMFIALLDCLLQDNDFFWLTCKTM